MDSACAHPVGRREQDIVSTFMMDSKDFDVLQNFWRDSFNGL